MRGPSVLREAVGRVKSRMGACVLGSHTVFRGKRLHAELKDMGWMELYLFGITGRRFSAPQLRLLQASWVYTSYPDARIWNNRVAALAGSARSAGSLGLSAALAVSDARIYGGGSFVRGIEFFIRARVALAGGEELGPWVRRELAEQRILAGYGRPITHEDERIGPMMELARSLELANGPHLDLAFAVEKCLAEIRPQLRMNYGGLLSALAADMGFSPREYHLFMYPIFLAGMAPCYLEATERKEGTLFPLPCEAVSYLGAPKRKWSKP